MLSTTRVGVPGGLVVGHQAEVGVADPQADEERRPLVGEPLGDGGAEQAGVEGDQPIEIGSGDDR